MTASTTPASKFLKIYCIMKIKIYLINRPLKIEKPEKPTKFRKAML